MTASERCLAVGLQRQEFILGKTAVLRNLILSGCGGNEILHFPYDRMKIQASRSTGCGQHQSIAHASGNGVKKAAPIRDGFSVKQRQR
jgi:hypothetical protein